MPARSTGNATPVFDHPPVWIIFTGNHPTDVVSEREDGDTLPEEHAVEYVPVAEIEQLRVRLESCEAHYESHASDDYGAWLRETR